MPGYSDARESDEEWEERADNFGFTSDEVDELLCQASHAVLCHAVMGAGAAAQHALPSCCACAALPLLWLAA